MRNFSSTAFPDSNSQGKFESRLPDFPAGRKLRFSINGLGTLVLAWGLYQLAILPTLLGIFGQYAMKFWFLDRMVWLYDEMHLLHEPYAEWLY